MSATAKCARRAARDIVAISYLHPQDGKPQEYACSRKLREPKLINTSELFQNPLKRKLYSFLLKPGLEKALSISDLNNLYADSRKRMHTEHITFMEAVLRNLDIQFDIPEEEVERLRKIEGPIVVVCNHPFGGLEALFLMIVMDKIRPGKFKTMANFMLQIPELVPHLIFVDPFDNDESKQRNIGPLKDVMRYLNEGGLLGIFPAGEVASFDLKTRKVREPEWNANITKIIQRTKATVVPLYFHGHNSFLFQMAGVIHARLRTTLLIREFTHPRNNRIVYALGKPILPEKLKDYKTPEEITEYLRRKTLLLRAMVEEQEQGVLHKIRRIVPRRKAGLRDLQPVAAPVDPAILRDEIRRMPQNVLYTHNNFQVICFRADEGPGLLMEIGRLRELTFREVGEGSGKSIDLDQHDYFYHQLIVWDEETGKVVGGYRMGEVDTILREQGMGGLYITSLFDIQPELFAQIGGALELGRSFVAKEYQKNFYSLFLLWVGIGRFMVRNPYYKNLLGPVSISNDYHVVSKNMLVNFLLENHFDTNLQNYVQPRNPFRRRLAYEQEFYEVFQPQKLQDVHDLISEIEKQDRGVPILIKHYLKMGSRILAFNVDPEFQNCLDALMLTDLTRTEPSLARKYMGDDGYVEFMAYHSQGQAAQK
ncbi:MAG: lysophospholipid acyltransferase family protein [Bacteroidetes bacterium]|nr:lysophospholipid acyltransferase family protein [Bacteroidota bacterium]